MKQYIIDIIRKNIFAAIPVAVVMFLIWLTVQPVEARWADTDVVLCTSLIVISSLGLVCLAFSRECCRFTVVDCLAVVCILYYVVRVCVGSEFPCVVEFLGSMEMVALYVALRLVFHDGKVPAWVLILFLAIGGCYEALNGIIQLISGTSRHHIFLLTGTFQNPGPYSAYLMIVAAMLMMMPQIAYGEKQPEVMSGASWINKAERMVGSYGLWTALILTVLVIPATWSRAAFVGLGLCMLWTFRKRYWKYRFFVWGGVVVLAVAFYFIKRGSADGRTVIWLASLTSWMHNVWTGVGVGGFRNACAEGIAELWNADPQSQMFASAGVTEYAFNVVLKVLVEQGVVGALLWCTLTVTAVVRLYRMSQPLFMGIMSLLVFAMFSYPFELLPYKIIMVMVIAWSESGIENASIWRVSRWYGLGTALLVGMASWVLRCEVVRNVEAEKDCKLFSRMQTAAFLDDYYELLPFQMDNPQYLFDFAHTLRNEGRYRDSNAILRYGVHVSADPMFYIIMGNNYKDEGLIKLAEEAYNKAYSVMPNRMYPKYQLMMMYDEIKDSRNIEMANQIRSMTPKIESAATRQMRWKADSIFYRSDMVARYDENGERQPKR